MKLLFRSVFLIALSTSLIGCASKPKRAELQKVDPVLIALQDSVDNITRYARELHSVEAARLKGWNGSRHSDEDLALFPALTQVYSLDSGYTGTLENLLTEVSVLAQLEKPVYQGMRPPSGIPISVNARNKKVIDVVWDAVTMAKSKVRVTLLFRDRKFVIEYLGY